jgi:hypothetical protein
MSAAIVLAEARAAGVEVLIYGGRLASRGPATPELRAAIQVNKAALVALLTGKPHHLVELPPLPCDDEHGRWLRGEPDPIAWIERNDVRLLVEDLADQGWRPGRISRTLGLRRDEVATILRRSGR